MTWQRGETGSLLQVNVSTPYPYTDPTMGSSNVNSVVNEGTEHVYHPFSHVLSIVESHLTFQNVNESVEQ